MHAKTNACKWCDHYNSLNYDFAHATAQIIWDIILIIKHSYNCNDSIYTCFPFISYMINR